MSFIALPSVQDTTVVALATDALTLAPGWIGAVIAVVAVALLVVLLLVLFEVRRLGNTCSRFATATEERTRPLVEHANAAARNVEHITQLVRNDLGRVNEAFTGLADGIGDASGELQKRLKDLMALLDLAQSEAEDAVLEAASKVRAFRSGIGMLRWPPAGAARGQESGEPAANPAGETASETTGEPRSVPEPAGDTMPEQALPSSGAPKTRPAE